MSDNANLLPESIRSAILCSRIFAKAKANIGLAEKEHILGLARLLEQTVLQLQEPQKIELTHYQIRALLELSESSGDPEHQDDLILQLGDEKSHSGPGLYAYFAECPEEGSTFIGRDAEDQARGAAIAEERGHD